MHTYCNVKAYISETPLQLTGYKGVILLLTYKITVRPKKSIRRIIIC